MPRSVYLGLGSNLGDRLANLSSARSALAEFLDHPAFSSIYETEPWGYTDQPAFLNQAVSGAAHLTPTQLLKAIKAVEQRLGRQPSFRYGPRLIDIDILLYRDLILKTTRLEIPHPRLAERAFVLIPLLEIAPDIIHPVLGQTVRQLAARVDASGVRRLDEPSSSGAAS